MFGRAYVKNLLNIISRHIVNKNEIYFLCLLLNFHIIFHQIHIKYYCYIVQYNNIPMLFQNLIIIHWK